MTEIRRAQHADGILAPKPNGLGLTSPVCRNTLQTAVATSTVKRGFVSSKFWGLVRLYQSSTVTGEMGLSYPNSKDRGRSLSARTPARLFACYEHLVHLKSVVRLRVGSLIQTGIQTMTPVTQGRTAPTHIPTEEARALAALEAANCAALARWYSARGNVKAARRKAVQLLAALAVLEGVQHA